MSLKTLQLTPELYQYLLSHSAKETPELVDLRERTRCLPMAKMQISPEQGQFMQFLVSLMGARRTIEVGVFTGYSSLCTALALPDDGEVIACDISEDYTNIAKEYWQQAGVSHKIKLHLQPAEKTLQTLLTQDQSNQFDFAFIDADKNKMQCYFDLCLELVRPNGLILIDNTLWSGNVANADINDDDTMAIRQFNDVLYTDSRVEMVMLPIGDGLSLARKL